MNVLTILMFVFALALSGVAAFYAIFGLVAIFAAAPIAIIVMGSLLEGSKLVIASWLYRNWKQVPLLLKSYFVSALVVLMFLTSMGIFGFLSRAHIEQKASSQDTTVLIAELDRQIAIERSKIEDATTVISQLDQVVQTLTNSQRIRGAEGALAVRQSQAEERQQYNDMIRSANEQISKLQQERLPLVQQQASLEAEIGPLKYVAALIYGDNPDTNMIERAVRYVIILIVAVFDPLAVLMLIAANWSIINLRKNDPLDQVSVEPEIRERVKEVMKEVVQEAKQKKKRGRPRKTIEPEPPAEKSGQEHPAFEPDNNKYWVSRPPPKTS